MLEENDSLQRPSFESESSNDDQLTKAKTLWRERATVAIVLPSYVEKGQYAFRMANGGGLIEALVKWPKTLVDLEMLHNKFSYVKYLNNTHITQNTPGLKRHLSLIGQILFPSWNRKLWFRPHAM